MSLYDGVDVDDDGGTDIINIFNKISDEYIEEYDYYVLYTAIFKRNDSKLRVNIKAHYNERESVAEVHIYDPNYNQWNDLCELHYSKIQCGGYSRLNDYVKELIQKDVRILLKKTEDIIIR